MNFELTTTIQRLPIILRWAGVSILCLSLFLPQDLAHAHPVDMYAQELFVVLTQTEISIDWKITPGPLLADTVWAAADGDRDGSVSPQEARAWVAPFLAQLSVTLEGRSLDNLRVDQIHWPTAIGILRTGEDAIRMHFSAPWPAQTTGKRRLKIHNAYLETNSLDWFSLTVGQGLSFDTPLQKNGQLETDIHTPAFVSTLTSWNSGQPDLAGIGGALSNLADPAQTGSPVSALVGLVKAPELSPLFLVGALLLSLALGSLHALTPGHGKALVAAYLVGSRGRSRDAVFLGLVVTLTHTGSVVLLGLLTLLASQYILPGLIAPWLEIISGLLVVVFGVNLFLQRRQVLSDWWVARRAKQAAKNRLNQETSFSLQGASLSQPAARFGLLNVRPAEAHGPGHTHLPVGAVTWKSLLALGVSGGLVPCPDAIAILLVAVAINRILFGMLLILAFSVGLALVLIVIGLAMLQGLRFFARNARNDIFNRFSLYTPLVSALVVCGLGVGLTFSAVNALRFTSAQASGPVFDMKRASLLYLFPDSRGKHQLTRLPLGGGAAIAYTDEPDSVAGYAVAPDGKTIVYTVFRADGKSLLWVVDADGTHARQVLDCQHAQCGGPVWHPDGHRLIYQRADYADDASLPRFSLWWLDVASGETRPVFQDGTFASYAPAFSPDGQWLSYKSPANNTVQIYNLQDGRAISIAVPVQSGASEIWGPGGDALLFWDKTSSDVETALHVKRYDLGSGQKTDLGGEPSQRDYAAAWSPDGAWVAIEREPPDSAPLKRGDQLWLVRPDGSDARLLMSEVDVSYSDIHWGPDSQSLVYLRYSYANVGESEIWRVDIQTGEKTKLVSGGISPMILP